MGELRAAIEHAAPEEWAQLVGKIMREARDSDVWHFVTPRAVWERRADLDRYLGRRRAFWHYLLDGWHRDGFLGQHRYAHRLPQRRGEDSTRVDFVRGRGPQVYPKLVRDGIAMDSVEEIIANKITTLAPRSEVRDVVDLYHLEQAGYRVEDHVEGALRKDAGATPATIAWLLSTLRVPERVPGDQSRDVIVDYVKELEARFRKLALPASE